ncbi:hypothetical protein [Stutzerimonas kirkiae]|uniref:Uncharacterized protein n=1 Tax=Stutzerimonas kirkiae TaxID=2211392 RepID=A0A4Q9R9Q1_9GAMM|nr:hypothetical protein [Stutzerimonas kirkiae]TBU96852.1 hypothetical protein DNJ96_09835 [Stutzerimonas kirkiae]TBV00551.1 hypothetical protein DNJ95_14635 [Stutzerimonas kirkiae]TBV08439.1 hypothetical protein DNK08_11045 [Stutzerimonas kirkiae]TBV16715.1 hypothetical protein DNK01_02355 [Stutzerimonas kirkiae]
MRQPDIEIYLKDASQQAVSDWLQQAIGACTPWQRKGQTFKCNANGIPVTWLPRAVGKWHCLLLESAATPWPDDLACAHAAHQALAVEIRCAPGGWQEEEALEEADRWISVGQDGEREIRWHTD